MDHTPTAAEAQGPDHRTTPPDPPISRAWSPLLPPKLADPFWLLAFTGAFCTNGCLALLALLLLLLAAAREPQSVWHQARRLLVRRCSRLVVLGRVLLLAPLLAMGFAVSARRTTLPPRQEPVLP